MLTEPEHDTTVRHAGTIPDRWYADCECGWRSADEETEDDAENAATGHQVEERRRTQEEVV